MSLLIPVTDNIRFASPDPNNYTLEQRRVVQSGPNKGKEQWDVLGYYGSLRGAAHALLKGHFSALLPDLGREPKDLQTLIDAVDEGAALIARACETAELRAKPARSPVTSSSSDEEQGT